MSAKNELQTFKQTLQLRELIFAPCGISPWQSDFLCPARGAKMEGRCLLLLQVSPQNYSLFHAFVPAPVSSPECFTAVHFIQVHFQNLCPVFSGLYPSSWVVDEVMGQDISNIISKSIKETAMEKNRI